MTKWDCIVCKREFEEEIAPVTLEGDDPDGKRYEEHWCEECFGQSEAWHSEWSAHMQMKHGGIFDDCNF